jgi:hypothetical protein
MSLINTSQAILDFSVEFNVAVLDQVVMAFYSGTGQGVNTIYIDHHVSIDV